MNGMLRFTINSSEELDRGVKLYTNQGKNVMLLFTGNKKNGQSWCPDCNVADPIIEIELDKVCSDNRIVFFTVPVGDLSE